MAIPHSENRDNGSPEERNACPENCTGIAGRKSG